MQIPRFTSSKPSEFAFASDEKSIRRPTASFVRCHLKNRRAGNPARPIQAVKNPRRAREGRSPPRLLIEPGGVYGGCGRIFAAENPIFQSKNRFLADFAPGDFEEILAKSGRGGEPAGFEPTACRLGELVSYFLSISSRSIFCHFTLICQEILRVFLNDRPV